MPAKGQRIGCRVCKSPQRADIESAIYAGLPFARIDSTFGLGAGASGYHSIAHLAFRRGAGTCQVCSHPQLDAVNADILDPRITYKDTAVKWGVSINSIKRHTVAHIETTRTVGRPCGVCVHPDRDLIEAEVELGRRSRELIAQWFGLYDGSVIKNHMEPDHLAADARYQLARLEQLQT